MPEVQERACRADVFVGVREDRQEELTKFNDLFSRGAAEYALHRPRYPARLFSELADRAAGTDTAWDCATGNGQAAIGLADHFRRVIATDASEKQIASAIPHPRVSYRVARAEASGLDSSSVDIVTAAQALHWLDRDAFYREAKRVLADQGIVAVWCYSLLEIDDRIDRLVRRFYAETVGSYWAPERRLVEDGYRSVEFPFDEFELPRLAIEQQLTLEELGGYLRTWSATQAYVEQLGVDPVEPLLREMLPLWGRASDARDVTFPLSVRAGRYQRRTAS